MLLKFVVKNYKSFKDETTFSFLRSDTSKSSTSSVKLYNGKYEIYHFSAIVGRNASGKTNFIDALSAFVNLVLNSKYLGPDGKINIYKPFCLDLSSEKEPTVFEIEFISKLNHYNYKVEFNDAEILLEELYLLQHNKNKLVKILIFERHLLDIKFEEMVKDTIEKFQNVIDSNKLILSVIGGKSNSSIIEDVDYYFKNELRIFYLQKDIERHLNKFKTEKLVRDLPEVKPLMKAILKSADTQISDININMSDEISTMLNNKGLDNYPKGKSLVDELSNITSLTHSVFSKNHERYEKVFCDYEGSEASSTMKLYEISDEIINALITGTTLVVDSFTSYFDFNVASFIVKLFSLKEINKKGAQLLVTSKDLNLIENLNLLKDQIWIVEKTNNGESDLVCFNDLNEQGLKALVKMTNIDKDTILLNLLKKAISNFNDGIN